MPRTVNINYVTKEVKILLHDSETESLAAATAIAAAESAQEAKDVVVDNLQDSLDAIDAKTETEKTELDDYTETKKTEIETLGQGYVDSASQKVDEANTILTAIRNEYGYPFTAATAAAMTDTTKIYVYTGNETDYTNGNWYYYNGTAWVSGGIYNAVAFETDKTFSISGAAADSAVTGYNINTFKKADVSLFAQGYINSSGAETSSNNTIRTQFLSDDIIGVEALPSWSDYYLVSVYNKSDDSYVGNWDGSVVVTGSLPHITRKFYFAEIPNHESYKFRFQAHGSSITPATASNLYFICRTDTNLSAVGRSADANAVGNVFNDCDRKFNDVGKYINYGYSFATERLQRTQNATNTTAFYVERKWTTFTVSNSAISNPALICLTGNLRRAIRSSVANLSTGITLTEGHKYVATLKCLNDSAKSAFNSISVAVYKAGAGTNLASAGRDEDNKVIYCYFQGINAELNITFYVVAGASLDNAAYDMVLQDMTELVDAGNGLISLDSRVNILHGLLNYGYSADKTDILPEMQSESDSSRIGVSQTGTMVTLNTLGIANPARIRITSGLARTINNGSVDGWTSGIKLESGHSYRITTHFISEDAVNNINAISVSVYKVGTHNTIGTYYTEFDKNVSYREFIAGDEELNFSIYLVANTVLSNAVLDITLSDITYETDEEDEEIKTYYYDEMTDTITKAQNLKDEPCLTFMWATDIHRHSSNAAGVQTFTYMIQNMKAFSKSVHCDFVLNTGDDTDGNVALATTLQRAYDMTKEFMSIGVPYIKSNGNHDNNPYNGDSNVFNINQSFKAYYTLTPHDVTINVAENGTDFYVDYNDLGVRFVAINDNNVKTANTYSWGETTPAWIESALNTNKTVLLSLHISPIRTQVYNNQRVTTSERNTAVLNAFNSFVNNGGNLIMLSGHSHADMAFITPFLSVMEICQRFYTDGGSVDDVPGFQAISGYIDVISRPVREAETYTEDAWTVGIYKPISNELHLIRFGAGTDRHFHVTPIAPTTVTTMLTGTITWSSSDESVATVSDGVITGVSTGKCAVLAKDASGNYECWIVSVE